MGDYDNLSDDELTKVVQQRMQGSTNTSPSAMPSLPLGDPSQLSDDDLDKAVRAKQAGKDPSSYPGIYGSVTTKNEMPDDVSYADRFTVTNTSNNPQSSVKFIQGKYPDYDVVHDGNHVLMRKKGSLDPWQPLDPSFSLAGLSKDAADSDGNANFFGPEEIAGKAAKRVFEKVGDVALPAAEGFASNVPGDVVGGAMAFTPAAPAAVPTAMGINAVTGTGLDALRQKLGNLLGLDQSTDWKQAAEAGVASGAGTLLGGTGSSAENILAQAAEKGVSKQAAETAVNSQKGVLARVAPKAWSALSGIPEGTINTAYGKAAELKQLEQDGVSDLASQAHENLKGSLQQATTQLGQTIADGIDASKQTVDISGVKSEWKNYLQSLESKVANAPTDANRAELNNARTQYEHMFQINLPGEEPSSLLNAKGQPLDAGMPAMKAELPDKVSGSQAFQLMQQSKEVGNLGAQKPALMAATGGTPLSTTVLENKAKSAYHDLSDKLDELLSKDGYSDLRGQYSSYKSLQRELNPFFSTPDKTYSTLRTMDSPSKQTLYEKLASVDDNLGTHTVDDAKLLDAYSTFSRKAPISGWTGQVKNRAPLTLLGAGAGAIAGDQIAGNHEGVYAGAPIGAFLGAMAAGPAATKGYLNIARAAAPAIAPSMPSVWDILKSRQNQNDLKRGNSE